MIHYENDLNSVDWQQAVEIYRHSYGKGDVDQKGPEKLAFDFQVSHACVLVYDDQRLIGLSRAFCRKDQATIHDVAILPEYQGKQIGKEMLRRLCQELPVEHIIAQAHPGSEGFYKKCGFTELVSLLDTLRLAKKNPDRPCAMILSRNWGNGE